MKIFISWSGPVSQQIASEFRDWIPLILPAVKPFITSSDIDKGARWQGEISRELDESNYGIVCLTADNLNSQWIAFEAGALSKHLSGKVATILFRLRHQDVHQPLGMFQGTVFTEADVRQLVSDINKALPDDDRRSEDQLDKLFPKLWPDLEQAINLILDSAAQANPPAPPAVDLAAQLSDMTALLRQQSSLLSDPERLLGPVLSRLGGSPFVPPSDYTLVKLPIGSGKTRTLDALVEWVKANQVTAPTNLNPTIEVAVPPVLPIPSVPPIPPVPPTEKGKKDRGKA